MKIDFSQVIKNMDGSDAIMPKPGASDVSDVQTVTLGKLCGLVLDAPNQSGNAVERGKLAMMIYGESVVEVTPEQITLVRSALRECKGMSSSAIAQAHEMLDA